MDISYEEAVAAQTRIEDKLLEDPNVVSVGVVEEVDMLGRRTGNYIIQVGVISMETYKNEVKHGKSVIPPEYVLHSESGTEEDKHIRVNVVKEDKIEALSSSKSPEKRGFPSAIDDIQDSPGMAGDTTLRLRPSPCGQSIGHPEISARTMRLLLEYSEGPNSGKAYILSNNHVLAINNLAYVGDAIIQPGKHDSGVVGEDTIATLWNKYPSGNIQEFQKDFPVKILRRPYSTLANFSQQKFKKEMYKIKPDKSPKLMLKSSIMLNNYGIYRTASVKSINPDMNFRSHSHFHQPSPSKPTVRMCIF